MRTASSSGVWIGNDDNTPLQGVSGGGLPARIWRDFMTGASGRKAAPRPKPVDPAGPVAIGALTRIFAQQPAAIIVAPLANAGAPLATALLSLAVLGVVPGPLKSIGIGLALIASRFSSPSRRAKGRASRQYKLVSFGFGFIAFLDLSRLTRNLQELSVKAIRDIVLRHKGWRTDRCDVSLLSRTRWRRGDAAPRAASRTAGRAGRGDAADQVNQDGGHTGAHPRLPRLRADHSRTRSVSRTSGWCWAAIISGPIRGPPCPPPKRWIRPRSWRSGMCARASAMKIHLRLLDSGCADDAVPLPGIIAEKRAARRTAPRRTRD